MSERYQGPSGVVFTRDELLVIWAALNHIPTAETGPISRRIKRYLEVTENGPDDQRADGT